jgi:hypothetical protein
MVADTSRLVPRFAVLFYPVSFKFAGRSGRVTREFGWRG